MIYVTGDTHGELSRFDASQMKKVRRGDTVIVCGDFGFIWDGGEREEKNLKKLGNKKYRILFIDGTHENFDLLKDYPVEEFQGGKARHICGNLYHLMRGQIYEIEGKKIFAFGGGESTERQMRIEANRWWPCEMPNMEEMHEGVQNLKDAGMRVDYIITHSPPPRVSGMTVENSNQLDAYFEQIVKQVRYEKWFFGSLHIDRKVTYKNFGVFQGVLPVWEEPTVGKRARHMKAQP